MKRDFAKIGMRKANNTAFRPEQFNLQEFFKVYAPAIHTDMEYPIMMGGQLIARADLVDLDNKIVYRLDGGSHTGRRVKDENQRIWLETMGWKVEDLKKDSFEWNWLWNDMK